MTPNPLMLAIGQFVRDLLTYDEQLIKFGRQNFEQADFEQNYIVIDALGLQQRVASLEDYDGEAEVLSLGGIWKGPVTLDFYGDGAYSRAIDFSLRVRSQAAFDLKKVLGVEIQQPKGPIDVKQLTGQQYGERQQLELMVSHSANVNIDTLRIDTAQLEIRNEGGIEYVG